MCGCSSSRSRISRTSPSASTRPLWMSSTRRVSASTSCRMWLETTTVGPRGPSRLTRSITRRRFTGSSPDTGSSSSSTSRLVRDRLRDLDALAHALAVAADLAVLRVGERDRLQRLQGALLALGVVVARQAQQADEELQPGQAFPERIRLRAEPDAMEHLGRSPRRTPEQAHLALAGRELAGAQLQERGLARAVRAQQAGDARRQRRGDVVERDHGPVPARGADELDRHARRRRRRPAHRTISTARTRERNTSRRSQAQRRQDQRGVHP